MCHLLVLLKVYFYALYSFSLCLSVWQMWAIFFIKDSSSCIAAQHECVPGIRTAIRLPDAEEQKALSSVADACIAQVKHRHPAGLM